MTYAIGRGVRVEVGITEGSPITVTEVTAANPPVATATAHGLLADSIAYFATATGMPRLEGQSVRLEAVAANSFDLEDLDTTNYGDFTAGSVVPISAWSTLVSSTEYNKAGGEASSLDTTVLLDEQSQEEAGPLAAESVTFSGRMETIGSTALTKVRSVAREGGKLVFRITLKDGSVRHFRGSPGIPSEQLSQGAVGSYSFNVIVKQHVLEGAA